MGQLVTHTHTHTYGHTYTHPFIPWQQLYWSMRTNTKQTAWPKFRDLHVLCLILICTTPHLRLKSNFAVQENHTGPKRKIHLNEFRRKNIVNMNNYSSDGRSEEAERAQWSSPSVRWPAYGPQCCKITQFSNWGKMHFSVSKDKVINKSGREKKSLVYWQAVSCF